MLDSAEVDRSDNYPNDRSDNVPDDTDRGMYDVPVDTARGIIRLSRTRALVVAPLCTAVVTSAIHAALSIPGHVAEQEMTQLGDQGEGDVTYL
jgi:hypothetical protein